VFALTTNTCDSVPRLTGTFLENSSNTVLDKSEYLYNADNQRIRHTRTDASYYTRKGEKTSKGEKAKGKGVSPGYCRICLDAVKGKGVSPGYCRICLDAVLPLPVFRDMARRLRFQYFSACGAWS